MTAASLSAPSVSGVLYRFLMGTGVLCVNRMTGKLSCSNLSITRLLNVITDESIPRWMGYFRHSKGRLSSVWLEQWTTSNGSPWSKMASLATVFPISMIKFTVIGGFADAKLH